MEIQNMKMKVKCDASGCNNLAEYRIINKKIIFCGSFYLCENCLNELYNLISKFVIPKSPQPIFKKKGEKNEQN